MTMTDLDDKLTSLAAPVPESARSEAHRMATATMPRRLQKGRAPRARWVLPIVIGGAVALTAGAGTATVAMSHWAGVEMPLGNIRNTEPIPVTWTTDSGHIEECRVWVEIRNPESGDQARLNEAVTNHDWAGLGQRLYDEGPTSSDEEAWDRVNRGLIPVVQHLANEAFPGIVWFGSDADANARGIDAWGMTCVPEAD